MFQWGWFGDLLGVPATGPVISFLPVILMAVLFGLAMDYEVFLVSRMREEYAHGAEPREAVVTGARHAARVVVAAALIMFSVFASFVTIDDVVVKAIAFGLAVGILVDAFVVRMTLVPAVLALLGRSAWWLPRWLDRILPDLDVEGARLGGRRPAVAAREPVGDRAVTGGGVSGWGGVASCPRTWRRRPRGRRARRRRWAPARRRPSRCRCSARSSPSSRPAAAAR